MNDGIGNSDMNDGIKHNFVDLILCAYIVPHLLHLNGPPTCLAKKTSGGQREEGHGVVQRVQ